ncbi:hypothetical protein [Nocardia wallacei]|uniref:hypothetical protein n=1 Tax=Nocardia wallacei TaxID=480035 RepID=UPI0024544369|nr:hypothetical protein [Nocardia wallacei]
MSDKEFDLERFNRQHERFMAGHAKRVAKIDERLARSKRMAAENERKRLAREERDRIERERQGRTPINLEPGALLRDIEHLRPASCRTVHRGR